MSAFTVVSDGEIVVAATDGIVLLLTVMIVYCDLKHRILFKI